jgi:hypothetical protein
MCKKTQDTQTIRKKYAENTQNMQNTQINMQKYANKYANSTQNTQEIRKKIRKKIRQKIRKEIRRIRKNYAVFLSYPYFARIRKIRQKIRKIRKIGELKKIRRIRTPHFADGQPHSQSRAGGRSCPAGGPWPGHGLTVTVMVGVGAT